MDDRQLSRKQKLIKYVVPSTLSMVSIFVYSVVDGVFVGRGVGQDALGAVNIAWPYVMIFTALLMLVTIGGLTITAIRKGRGEIEGMNIAFMHSSAAAFLISFVFMILGTVFVGPVARAMGANDTFFDMVCEYIFWYSVFMVPCGMCTAFSGFVRNDGDPFLVSVGTVTACVLNIFGDWLTVFPLHMGLKGAAIATGASQTIALLIYLSHFARKRGTLRFEKFKVDWDLYKLIIKRGLPECVGQFNCPIVTILYNIELLARLGDIAENAYAVICYVASFAVAAFCGVAEGLQPLFGNSYGEGNAEDLVWYRRTGIVIGLVGAVIIYVALFFVGRPICVLYGLDAETVDYAMETMPKYSIGFVVQSTTVIITSYLYSTTRTKEALIINVLRSFIVDTAVILLLPVLFGNESIWYAFAVYEAIMLVIAVIVMKKADAKGIIGAAKE